MNTTIYTPSVNIKRDFNTRLQYLITPNANRVFNLIVSNFHKGARSFNLIGAYGTGKSSFIVAFEQSLKGRNNFFNTEKLFQRKVRLINIIGENASLIDTFAKLLNIDNAYSPAEIINHLDNYYKKLNNEAIVIVIDEFGKFLEYAAYNNPEKELYFIQQLAEFVNDIKKDILLLTVLHKNFNAYSLELTKTQIDEWNKVNGRLIELNFNEPVEQLLYIASEKIKQLNIVKKNNDIIDNLFNTIKDSKLFPLKEYNELEFAHKIYPFDLLSASVLTLALQEYGQNERSLFSFIENDDNLGLKNIDYKTNFFYNLSNVYDYLIFHHFSFISTKYNPHLNAWNNIKYAIEKIEAIFEENQNDAIRLVKTIGLLNIFSRKGGRIDDNFIESYSKLSLGINKPKAIIEKLVTNKIIHFTKFDSRYKLLVGTDLDFELAINEAGRLIEKIKDITLYLNRHFNFPIISAKRAYYQKGTPRFFSFVLSELPIKNIQSETVDGVINLIFNENRNIIEEIIKTSKQVNEPILYGFFQNTNKIERALFEIEKINKVIENNTEDKIAVQELKEILDHYKSLLNHYVIEKIYSNNDDIMWFFNGKSKDVFSQKSFNKLLSEICDIVYYKTPVFYNELINRSKTSGTISYARRNLFSHLLNKFDNKEFGFDDKKFPPEKMIFLSLIKTTGMYEFRGGKSILKKPQNESFKSLWETCDNFLNSTCQIKKSVTDLIKLLTQKPFKLKQGFIDFWIPLFLIANRDNTAIYKKEKNTGEMSYVPEINESLLDLINKVPDDYYLKRFDLSPNRLKIFNKYRTILNQTEQNEFSNKSFIETLKPFLVFYKSLPEYSRKTLRLSNKAIKFRNEIANSTDPEKVFFEGFPKALGYKLDELAEKESLVEQFVVDIKETVNEINNSFEKLIDEIEHFISIEIIGKATSYPENKDILQKRYKKLDSSMLKNHIKIFYNRLNGVISERRSWINSLVQSVIGKRLEDVTDKEVDIIKQKLKACFSELDNYNELSEEDVDLDNEEVIKLEITSFLKGLSKRKIHIPKTKMKKISTFEQSIKKQLRDNDKTFNIALLTKLLQDELNEEES